MKINWSLAVSLSIHAAILLAALVVLPEPEHFKVEEHDQIPVDIVSIEDVSLRSAMSKTAPDKTETPAPPKVETKKPDPKPAPKAAEEPKDAAKEPAPAPPPQADKTPEPAKPDAPTPDPSQLAELVKKTEPEKKPQEQPKPKPKPPTPQKPKPKFDPNDISALLNKIPDQAAATPDPTDKTGTPAKGPADFLNGTDSRMAANDIDWLRQKISNCWNPPVGVREAQNLIVRIRIDLAQDGSVIGQPEIMNSSTDPLFNAAAGAAVRAVMGCQPYDKLPAANYEIWKEIILNFDPSQMITG